MGRLAEAFAAAEVGYNGPDCGFWQMLAGMDEVDAATAREQMERPQKEMPSSRIGKTLRDEGYRIADDTVRRHRNKVCNCEKLGRR